MAPARAAPLTLLLSQKPVVQHVGVPAGLDGNPDPVSSYRRRRLLDEIVEDVLRRRADGRPLLVGVDGRSGSGKSTFADELARVLAGRGVSALRSTTDSFHNDRESRCRRGERSPEGYYRDSFNLDRLAQELLEPIRRGSGSYCLAVFDEPTDTPVAPEYFEADPSVVLIFDGLFLHRQELLGYWNLSVLLLSDERSLANGVAWAGRESNGDSTQLFLWLAWWWSRARRYVEGWQIYEAECHPMDAATFVVNNSAFAEPTIVGRG